MKIEIEITPEQLEIIAQGMSAARCGMDSLVKRASSDPVMQSIYRDWQTAFRVADILIPQNRFDKGVTQ